MRPPVVTHLIRRPVVVALGAAAALLSGTGWHAGPGLAAASAQTASSGLTTSQTVGRPLAFLSPGGDYLVSGAAGAGTVVGDIAVADSNPATAPSFSLTHGDGFAVHPSLGTLTTTGPLPAGSNSRRSVTVSVSDDGQTITSTFGVVILTVADYDSHGITSQHWNTWFDYGLGGTLVYPTTAPVFTASHARPAVHEPGGTRVMCTNSANPPNDKCGVRWSGYLVAPETGRYRFYVDGDGQVDFRIGTRASMSSLASGPLASKQLNAGTEGNVFIYTGEGTTGTVRLVRGQIYALEALANSHVNRDDWFSKLPHFNISWKTPSGPYPLDQKAATPVPSTVIPSSAIYPELVRGQGASEFSASPMTVMQSHLTAPGRPTVERVAGGAVTLVWENSTGGTGVDRYVVATDGASPVTVQAAAGDVTRTTLPASTGRRTYTVTAFDASGAASEPASLTADASIDYSALDHALATGDSSVLTDPNAIIDRFAAEVAASGNPGSYAAMRRTLDHVKARDWVVSPFSCDITHNCSVPSAVSAWRDSEFAPGTTDLRNRLADLQGAQVAMFDPAADVPAPVRLAVLLGDVLRRHVKYGKSSLRTGNGKAYYWAWYADSSVYDIRDSAPAAPDMGTYAYPLGADVPLFNDTLSFDTKRGAYTTAAGVYAPPGHTVTVRRTDSTSATVSLQINMLRSGATRETADYQRPKFLTRSLGALSPGESLTFTSVYGGPLMLSMGATTTPQAVTLAVAGVGHHPVWNGNATTGAFEQAMRDADYNWVDFMTPGYQVHARLWQMMTTLQDPTFNTIEKLADATFENFYKANFNLAGFTGANLSLSTKAAAICTAKGWDCTDSAIHGLAEMFHFNSDLSGCDAGYGCSGNPYDALWPFGPLGYGDSHELGHGMQNFLLTDAQGNGASGEVSNNIFAWHVYSLWNRTYPYKSQYTSTTSTSLGLTTDGQAYLYNIVNNAQTTADPTATLSNTIWGAGAGARFTSVNAARGTFFQQLVEQAAQIPGGRIGDAGWDVYPLMYIMDRLYRTYANGSEAVWLAKRDSLCMGDYSQAAARSIGNNDLFLIEASCVLGVDQRPFMDMWGLATGAAARDQVSRLGLPAAEKVWYVWPSDRINFHSQWPTSTSVPVDGQARTFPRVPEAVAWALDDDMTATVGQAKVIGAWLGAPGTVRFTANGTDIPGCAAVGTTYLYGGTHYNQWDYKATCNWTPPDRGDVVIKAYLTTDTTDPWYGAGRTNAETQDLRMAVRPGTPDASVLGVSVSPASVQMRAGDAQQLTVQYTPGSPSITGVTWASSDATVATVTSRGYVTALSPGTATITARSLDGGRTSSATVNVGALPVGVGSVSMASPPRFVRLGTTAALSAVVFPNYAADTSVSWSSSNPAAATVSSSGTVTPVAVGDTTITATTTDGGKRATARLTVLPAATLATGVTVWPATATLASGATRQFNATVAPGDATENGVTWSSSNAAVATVDSSGLVRGTADGTATITATTVDGGFTDTASVVVTSVTPPAAPTGAGATDLGTGGNVRLSWVAPPTPLGAPITGYRIERSSGDFTTWSTVVDDTASSSTTADVTGLVDGTAYRFRVTARNFAWWGESGAVTAPVSSTGVPSAPSIGLISPGNAQLVVAFTRLSGAATGGQPVAYTATATHPTNPAGNPSRACTVPAGASASSCTISGLRNGETYVVTLTAANARGTSLVVTSQGDSADRTPIADAPGEPTGVVASDRTTGGSVRVSWAPPAADGGAGIVGYRVDVSVNDGGWTTALADTASTTVDLSGYANGESLRFRVTARNYRLSGSPSAPSAAVVPTGRPGAVTISGTSVGVGTIAVAFSRLAGTDTGGLSVEYTATATHPSDPAAYPSRTCTVSTSSSAAACTIAGLIARQQYTVTLVASNSLGAGPSATAGGAASTRTPVSGPPGPPTGVALTNPGSGDAIRVAWAAPTETGALPLSGYRVEYRPAGGAWTVAAEDTASGSTSHTVTGLTFLQSYAFRVTARNADHIGGMSSAESPTMRLTRRPHPTAVTSVRPGPSDLTATFRRLSGDNQTGGLLAAYTVTASHPANPGKYPSRSCTVPADSTANQCAMTGLNAGETYNVSVVADNEVGASPATRSGAPMANRTPAGPVPGAPGDVGAVDQRLGGSVYLTWTPPAPVAGAPVAAYRIEGSTAPGRWFTVVANTGSALSGRKVSGLANGVPYKFRVSALSSAMAGAASAPSEQVSATARPSAVRFNTIVPGSRSLTVSFLRLAKHQAGGLPVSYTVRATAGASSAICVVQAESTATSCVVGGLNPGTAYTVRIAAANTVGTGATTTSTASAASTTPAARLTPAPQSRVAATTEFAGSISGTVTVVPGSASAEGICVIARLADGTEVSSALVAADGSYSIDTGDTTEALTVVTDAWRPGCSQQPLAPATASPVVLSGSTPAAEGVDLSINALAPRSITGAVVDGTTAPVAGACVALYDGPDWVASTTTEPTGRYVFAGPADGTQYAVHVSASGDECGNLAVAPFTSALFAVSAPASPVVLNVTLSAGSELRGLVSLPGGSGAPDMCVRAFLGPDYTSSSSEVRTGPDGRYVLEGLGVGTYGVQARDCDDGRNVLPVFDEGVGVAQAAAVVHDIAVRTGGVINGTVLVDAGQSPAGCAYVYPAGETDPALPWGRAVVGSDGHFQVTQLDGEVFDFHIVRGAGCRASPANPGTWFRSGTSAPAGASAAFTASFVTPPAGPGAAPAPPPSAAPAPPAPSPAAAAPSSGAGSPRPTQALPRAAASAAGTAARVSFVAPGPGRARTSGTAGGRVVCSGSTIVKKAGKVSVTCKLTAAAGAMRKKGALVVALTTVYLPKVGAPVTGASTVTFPRRR